MIIGNLLFIFIGGVGIWKVLLSDQDIQEIMPTIEKEGLIPGKRSR